MKHVFIINPNSGKAKSRDKFLNTLKEKAGALHIDYDVYYTKAPGDGQKYVRELCMKHAAGGETLRIYGCGGDGTVNEMANAVYGFDNVEVGIIPMGTGNDYVRNYGDVADFLDIESQLLGKAKYSDLIGYRAEYEGVLTEGYCANMFNIGFDCNVVDMTQRVKKWPLISGSMAYLIAVAIMFIKKKGADLRIQYEDGTSFDGKLLLSSVANGCFCGGGVKGAPQCKLNDGLMDVSVIKNISRFAFLTLFPSYAKGTHLEKEMVIRNEIIRYTKERKLIIEANGDSLRLCTDGEITTQKRVEFRMVPDAFKFIVPAKICE